MTLKFYPASHRYKLDGAWVPGVTTILGVLDKSRPLSKWAAESVATYVADNPAGVEELRNMGRGSMVHALKEIPWDATRKAQDRGTEFHTYAEKIAGGEEVDVPEHMVPLVEQALDFMDKFDIRPVLIEAAVASREHRYAGKLDLVADSNRGRCIFDWKSGKRIYPTTAFQLAAYAGAEFTGLDGAEHPLPDVEGSFGVHIRADGWDAYPLTFGPAVFGEFVNIRRTFDIHKRAEGNWKVPGTGYVGLSVQEESLV